MPSDFSSLLRRFRNDAGLSQEQLARDLKVSFATINRWETGKTVPEAAVLHVLADFVRKHGSAHAELADQFVRGGFTVPEKSRRGRRARPSEEERGALDTKAMETMLWKAA